MTVDRCKAPFPWFGGKADASTAVWQALGDPEHYVEPFAGSLAVLLRRPSPCNRTYHSETVNDLDGLLVNAWRGIQLHPDAVAEAASWPVSEADLHARHLWLLRWREEHQLEHLMGDPTWCDPQAAGWWLWGQSSWIGGGWCSGTGAWVVGEDGRICRRSGDGQGVSRKLPHIGNDGNGVNRPQLREPGVSRQLPHIGNNGQGVNHGEEQDLRIVLAGYEGEHPGLVEAGWREVEWFRSGFLKGGMGNMGSGHQQARERLWLSPHCLGAEAPAQGVLW